jgi:DNA-binding NarL/FixJ family response regulator
MQNTIKVGLVEDDHEIRQLMSFLINSSPGYSCVQAFEDCEKAIEAFESDTPDLVLMDIDLPGMSGIEGVGILKEKLPDLNIVMLTVHEDEAAVFDSLCTGAVGYLVKGLPPVQLLQAIKETHEGGAPMSPAIARKVIRSFQPNLPSPLSEREKEVLQMLCDGENYKTIAKALFISTNTVKAHIKNIYTKLNVNTRAEVVSKAIKQRLIK